ncbi:toll/interleukin-1 receptor domain-containing protein [Dyadobacter sp. NIV53]|uniref:toll/interleukin-1 receptor domain-containing protein n=1 Tax=Dyadobacter sp. NIV53 TaxID=2861765 RepID=UPI001C88DD7C|nr:toll/interleukin-1 receptor domain-containing protein [Dyadobacter sp. NIV53]
MKTSFSGVLRKLMITWIIFFSILVILILFQTTLGKFGDDVLYPFFWLLSCAVPYIFFVALRYRQIRNIPEEKQPEVDGTIGVIIKTVSILYLVTLLAVILIEPFFSSNNPIKYLQGSAPGLYVFQLILIAACIVLNNRVKKTQSFPDKKTNILKSEPVVFISYNHNDKAIAQEIRTLLEKKNIEVLLDSDDMDAGEVIDKFIIDSVNKSTATLHIISSNSLMSGYVSREAIRTFYSEEFTNKRKYIACYLDEEFKSNDFIIRSVKKSTKSLMKLKGSLTNRMHWMSIPRT